MRILWPTKVYGFTQGHPAISYRNPNSGISPPYKKNKGESREQGRECRDGNYYLILGGQERPTWGSRHLREERKQAVWIAEELCSRQCVCVRVCLFILEEEQGVVFPNSQQILIFGMQKQEIRTARSSPNLVIFKILPTFFIFFVHYHAIWSIYLKNKDY